MNSTSFSRGIPRSTIIVRFALIAAGIIASAVTAGETQAAESARALSAVQDTTKPKTDSSKRDTLRAALSPQGSSSNSGGRRSLASRTDLENAAVAAERMASTSGDKKIREHKRREAETIRLRLKDGDFQAGHRIYLVVPGDSALTDTFTVRGDQRLVLPALPEMSLKGVLDSELSTHLAKELTKYLKNPTVHAVGLLRVQMAGAIGRPGFYPLPTDMLLTDAIMTAGGPTPNSDLNKIVVKRGSEVTLKGDELADAVRLGLTLSDLGLRPGDQIEIGDKSTGGWASTGNVLRTLAALAFPIVYIARRF
jgi:hypothetical protein